VIPNLNSLKLWQVDAVFLGVCVAVTAAFALFGFAPLISGHHDFLAQRESLVAQEQQAAQLETSLANLRERVEADQRALAGHTLALKSVANVNSQLAEISSLATECGLRVEDIRPDSAVSGTYYDTVPVAVAGRGTYRDCTAFLNRLRRTLPDTGVATVELVANTGERTGQGKFRLDLQWYALKQVDGGK
jgi:Tfp pilus assembly protein PilO